MTDYQIELKGLRFFGHHGVFVEEQTLGQEFELDLWLEVRATDLDADQVSGVVDYGAVALKMQEVFGASNYHLIECLAEVLLTALSDFSGIQAAKLRIKKCNPPIPIPLDYVAVVLSRRYDHAP